VAGRELIASHAIVEPGRWISWCKVNVKRGMRDIQQVMKMAGDPEPEKAAAQYREADAERKRTDRAAPRVEISPPYALDVQRIAAIGHVELDLVDQALALFRQMSSGSLSIRLVPRPMVECGKWRAEKMVVRLELTGAHANDSATNLVLTGVDDSGQSFDIALNEDAGESLLAAFVSVLGQRARQRTGDKNLKKVLPVEWWEINPHPNRDGMLFSFRLDGGMELTFHIGAMAIPRFEEVLSTLTGTLPTATPAGPKN
jgi:hypothetical protein